MTGPYRRIVYQIFDRDTDKVSFNGVPFATAALAQARIDQLMADWRSKGMKLALRLVVCETEIIETNQEAKNFVSR